MKCGRCTPQMCNHSFSSVSHSDTNRSNVFIKMPEKNSPLRARRYFALLQLLHHSKRLLIHTALLLLLTPCRSKIHKQTKPVFQKQFSLSALYVTSLSLALILFYSFCDERYITRQAAQETLFRLVIAQKTQREGTESDREREVFF